MDTFPSRDGFSQISAGVYPGVAEKDGGDLVGYLLGIDQGGSKTAALVADRNGCLLGVGYAGGACHAAQGMAYAMSMAREAIAQALGGAGIGASEVEVLAAGMTGADWPEEYTLLRGALHDVTGIEEIKVVNDCIIAMRAGTEKSHGAILCAGTGLNAAVKSPDGREFIFGYYVPEEDQGGTALGHRAIRAVLAADVGIGPPTLLRDVVLRHFGLPDVDALLRQRVGNGLTAEVVFTLTPKIFETAGRGDMTAREVIGDFGKSIARYVIAGLGRFGMLDMETEVVLSGGLFKASLLLDVVSAAIHGSAPRAEIKNASYEPVVGAVLLALDEVHGKRFAPEIMENIRASSERMGLVR